LRRESASAIDRYALKDTFGWRAEDIAERWRAKHQDAISEVEALLTDAGISMDEVMAEALSAKMPEMATLESMLRSADERRYAALREIDRRRSALAQNARAFAHNLEVVESNGAGNRGASGYLENENGGVAGQDEAAA